MSKCYCVDASGADPYNFDTDPRSEKNRYGSGSRPNFDTDPDSGKNSTDPDPGKKGLSTRKILKIGLKNLSMNNN